MSKQFAIKPTNRPDDEEHIVWLVGQVVGVSVETVRIVSGLSATVAEAQEPA